ncbi:MULTISPECIES: ribosome silencing factor [Capnocytophaga]|uniref:Ribosomal silencing factor RsfS n=1 Tax=Capnocytophaga canis TaxID=1848903 RepID=A0A0B7I1S3_9FLAO|nr:MULTISPECIES: ribosome silencing factor [Capnocytophaga]ATA75553.1 ribosome silencing factor RsfS [Capnocytophaga sp. H2931]RIY38057.1 ribosome silencing factor [Capnocytophaga canis]CEN44092.1 Ribosomal silencing factor RsfS [Capnocytophaga canis]CEN44972.1 Ribosomal silencing factor RsfS [Capnocytophaga canis]GIM61498.1 ribosomal silencing factor RsfS [Capnocytophaga canis]
MTQNKEITSNQLISNIIEGIEKVKGTDITIMDLREIENSVCDYFVLCNGSSNTQVSAISGAVQRVVSQAEGHVKPWHVEGEMNAEWILIDYVDVVVHIFQKRIREHYDIEGLWGDAKFLNIETNY